MNGQRGRPPYERHCPFEPRHAVAASRREFGDEARLADPGRAGQDDDSSTAPREEIVDHGISSSAISLSRPMHGSVRRRGLSRRGRISRETRNGRIPALDGDSLERLETKRCVEPSGRGLSPTRIVPARPPLARALRRSSHHRAPLPEGRPRRTIPTAARPLLIPTRTLKPAIPTLLDVSRVLAHELEDAEAGERCPLRVVLVRDRHAEIRADAVALVRLHGPAVLLDGATHHRHALADERLGLLGRQALSERGRPTMSAKSWSPADLVCDPMWGRRGGRPAARRASFGRGPCKGA